MGRRAGRDYIRKLSQRENYFQLAKALEGGVKRDAETQANLLLGLIAGHNRLLRRHVDRAIKLVHKSQKIISLRRIEAYAEIEHGRVNQIGRYMPELLEFYSQR